MKHLLKHRSILAFTLVLAMMCSVFSGCGASTPDEVTHTAVIIGYTQNAALPNLNYAAEQIEEACRSFGTVTLISDEGTPKSTLFDIPEQGNLSSRNLQAIVDTQLAEIGAAAKDLKATTKEVNTMAALQLAARSLQSVSGKKELVILDSCLATTGAVKFTSLNHVDVDEIVAQLVENEEIPNLSGVNVSIYNCGDVAGNQAPIGEKNRKLLQTLWQSVCKKGNAAAVDVLSAPPAVTEIDPSLPDVTEVEVDVNVVDITDANELEEVLKNGGVITYDENAFLFNGDQATLVDRDKALTALAPLLEYLQTYQDSKLLLCGTTAGNGSEQYVMNLSSARAKTIVDLLVSQGVSVDRLESIGVGYFSEFYRYDHLPNGDLDEDIAPLNRSVKVMAAHSETATELKSIAAERGY